MGHARMQSRGNDVMSCSIFRRDAGCLTGTITTGMALQSILNQTGSQPGCRVIDTLLIDPARYRYGGPGWVVRMLDAVVAEPDLWVLLDAPPEVLRARKPEFDLAETIRQRLGYCATIAGRRSVLVVDATQPLKQVVAQVEGAILHLFKKRAAGTYAKHFKVRANVPVDGVAGQHETKER